MKKLNKLVVAFGATILVATTAMIGGAQAYSVNNTYQLGVNEGSNQRTNNRLVIAHETGTYAPAVNNAAYMKRTWNTNYAYTQYVVGDGGKVYRVGADGYVSWGAGTWGNANAPVQVELARTTNDAQFKVDYAVYVNLLRDSANKFGISTDLDTGYGIVTHKWITDNVWGDHQDPYGYLASHGISKSQFAQDLKTGLPENGSGTNTTPTNPTTPSNSNIPAGFTPENGTFVNGDTEIMNRVGAASFNAAQGGYLPAFASWKYDSWKRVGNYVMIHHVYNGVHVFLPVRYNSTAWGTFK
ncbi:peptidoglycan recognition protein family protein [Latilactobacillus curvatus]|uniref:peptidoglycan recognition protein family protein n=1 Tax=Latilactobacillus curvatus TaxID=28038 RepID=UPI00207460C9|nr:peptidoglycan recognition family protein [Latilactobacillus curvatus]MCM6843528.1 peptidoglycan recognition protein family protein [Latilactobacillus curvatus]MCM6861592.1 peptidoglycan recognition protein family protein [Latilactobacillus curvatus]MCM6868891.1 peptidoglycan recognition protein family protein [Latilactobacillus curvatus]